MTQPALPIGNPKATVNLPGFGKVSRDAVLTAVIGLITILVLWKASKPSAQAAAAQGVQGGFIGQSAPDAFAGFGSSSQSPGQAPSGPPLALPPPTSGDGGSPPMAIGNPVIAPPMPTMPGPPAPEPGPTSGLDNFGATPPGYSFAAGSPLQLEWRSLDPRSPDNLYHTGFIPNGFIPAGDPQANSWVWARAVDVPAGEQAGIPRLVAHPGAAA